MMRHWRIQIVGCVLVLGAGGAVGVAAASAGSERDQAPASVEHSRRGDRAVVVDLAGPDGKTIGTITLHPLPPDPSTIDFERAAEAPYVELEDGSIESEVVPIRPQPGDTLGD